MITKTYECKQCQIEFDNDQGIKDKNLEDCPVCKGPLVRVISGGTGFLLKGGGWTPKHYD